MAKVRILILENNQDDSWWQINSIAENKSNVLENSTGAISFDDALKLISDPFIPFTPETPLKRFGIFNANGENLLVHIHQICSIEASNKRCRFYCFDKEKNKYTIIASNESFGKVLERLPPNVFIQCHRSWIVNPEYVCNIIPNKKNGGVIKSGHPSCETIPYSDNFKDCLNEKFNLYKI